MDPKDLYNSGVTNMLIALTSVITAVGMVIVNVIIAKAKARVMQAADAVEKKADEIGETTKTTLGHVNSAATKMLAEIEALRKENELLRVTASDNKQIAALLAARAIPSQPGRAADTRATDTPQKVEVVNQPLTVVEGTKDEA